MEANNSTVQVHFSVNFIISGVVELYRNVGGGIFTLEDEEVCVLDFFFSYFFSSAERSIDSKLLW